MSGILILGAGGHGKVVADILLRQEIPVLGFLDDDPELHGNTRLGLPVLGSINTFSRYGASGLALGIGDTANRRRVAARLARVDAGLWLTAIHQRAIVAASVRLGVGVTIAAGAVINPDVVLGDHVIVNTGATVDHDCVIHAYAHIAPGAHLAGAVRVGEGTLVGVGASVLPGCTIGCWSVIGGGSAVVCDLPHHVTAKGVPARW
jgi:sugar O-acyltransferase (sialic acid O-acetyltransferase NeuD family)